MFKRAWHYITRKKLKTVLAFLILFCIGTLLFSGIAVKKAAAISAEKVSESIGSSFSIRNNPQYSMGNSRGAGTVSDQMIREIEELEGVTKCVRRMNGVARLENAKLVEKPELYGPVGGLMEAGFENALVFYGTDDSSMDSFFRMETIRLSEGRHITAEDTYTSMIHEDFAKANGLALGDELIFLPYENDYDNQNPATEPVRTTIVGLFEGETAILVSYADELNENIVLTDLQTMCTLYGTDKEQALYDYATFYTKDSGTMEQVMKEAMELEGDWVSYQLLSESRKFQTLGDSAIMLEALVDQLLIGTFAVGALILGLFLFLWIHGRVQETGIFLALGISKLSVILQYITELLLIAVLAVGMSYFAGQAAARSVGNLFIEQSSEQAVGEATGGMGAMLGTDVETTMLIKTIDDLQITVEAADVLAVAGLEAMVIIVAVLASSIPILKMKPREILSKMS